MELGRCLIGLFLYKIFIYYCGTESNIVAFFETILGIGGRFGQQNFHPTSSNVASTAMLDAVERDLRQSQSRPKSSKNQPTLPTAIPFNKDVQML